MVDAQIGPLRPQVCSNLCIYSQVRLNLALILTKIHKSARTCLLLNPNFTISTSRRLMHSRTLMQANPELNGTLLLSLLSKPNSQTVSILDPFLLKHTLGCHICSYIKNHKHTIKILYRTPLLHYLRETRGIACITWLLNVKLEVGPATRIRGC